MVSVAANLAPDVVLKMTKACLEDKRIEAVRLFNDYEALFTDLVFMDGNPVTIKEVMYQAGRLSCPRVRMPLVRTAAVNREKIRKLLSTLKLTSDE